MIRAVEFFPPFCDLNADRRQILRQTLQTAGLPFKELDLGGKHHFFCGPPLNTKGRKKFLVAHYDRVQNTPGANDNTASVFHLLSFAESLIARGPRHPWPDDLRLIFTDGEELGQTLGAFEQGSYALGRFLDTIGGREGFFTVFDMTGIGDTFVLGRAGETLLAQKPDIQTAHPELARRFAYNRLHARRILATGGGSYVEIPTPFSDDLGFLMAGIPAVQISLLPRKEALGYKKQPNAVGDQAHAPSWKTMHTPDDTPDKLWPTAFPLMRRLLDGLADYPLPRD